VGFPYTYFSPKLHGELIISMVFREKGREEKAVAGREKASRNGQDRQGVGEVIEGIAEGPGVHTSHIHCHQMSLPCPVQLGWSHSCPLHAGKAPKRTYQITNGNLKTSGLFGVSSF